MVKNVVVVTEQHETPLAVTGEEYGRHCSKRAEKNVSRALQFRLGWPIIPYTSRHESFTPDYVELSSDGPRF